MLERCRDTVRLGTAGILCGWALQGYSAAGHCRDTLHLGTEDTLRLGTAGYSAGYSAVGHCRDTWWLGTAEIFCGWALQGYSVVGHCRNTLPLSTAFRRARTT